jgi:hypothetical protein
MEFWKASFTKIRRNDAYSSSYEHLPKFKVHIGYTFMLLGNVPEECAAFIIEAGS